MNQNANAVELWTRENVVGILESACQIMRRHPQRFGNFHKRIHRGGFFSPFNTADKDGGKAGFFRQPFLAQTSALSLASDRLAQKTAMFDGRHGHSRDKKLAETTMSLTTDLCLCFPGCGSKMRPQISNTSKR